MGWGATLWTLTLSQEYGILIIEGGNTFSMNILGCYTWSVGVTFHLICKVFVFFTDHCPHLQKNP